MYKYTHTHTHIVFMCKGVVHIICLSVKISIVYMCKGLPRFLLVCKGAHMTSCSVDITRGVPSVVYVGFSKATESSNCCLDRVLFLKHINKVLNVFCITKVKTTTLRTHCLQLKLLTFMATSLIKARTASS